jgi:hypothetical protein
MALCGAVPIVAQVLESAGVKNVVPVSPDLEAARATLPGA